MNCSRDKEVLNSEYIQMFFLFFMNIGQSEFTKRDFSLEG